MSIRIIQAATLAFASLALTPALHAAPVKVAFIGDQGNNSNARAVLTLVANEGTDLLLIQGDLGYTENAASEWNANITNALGSNFPVLAVVGNHENFQWPVYKNYIQQRIDQNPTLNCLGNTGVKALCNFANIDIVQVAPGIHEVAGVSPDDSYEDYIRTSLSSSEHRWKICAWHKNQRDMQPADKGDSTGWAVYDACLDAGAMIAMGHAHSYSRTYLLSDFQQKTVVHRSNDMTLKPGQALAVVSGLGGRDVVPQQHGGDWFASIYTASQGATHGALFCTFETSTADCYFKAIDGAIPDRFTLTLDSLNNLSSADALPAPPPPPAGGYVFSRTDVSEYRWVDYNDQGQLASVWITQACSNQLGGPTVTGDWDTLSYFAPEHDGISSPCVLEQNDNSTTTFTTLTPGRVNDVGYVYSRTDKQEFRWIARDDRGVWGSIWINESCANRLGGAQSRGDWFELMIEAPGFDSIPSPCS